MPNPAISAFGRSLDAEAQDAAIYRLSPDRQQAAKARS